MNAIALHSTQVKKQEIGRVEQSETRHNRNDEASTELVAWAKWLLCPTSLLLSLLGFMRTYHPNLQTVMCTWQSYKELFSYFRARSNEKDAKTIERVHLRTDEVRSVNAGTCSTIVCEFGIVWLTQQGDARDHVPERGQKFQPKRRGLIVIWSLTEALLEVHGR
jgi:hypothetical protein